MFEKQWKKWVYAMGEPLKNCYFSHYSLVFNVIQRVIDELWKQLHFNQQSKPFFNGYLLLLLLLLLNNN
jgi:hypothetical protein